MNMKKLKQIQDEISSIISSYGMSGAIINSIGNLLSEAIYRNEITSVVSTLEQSPTRCRNLNSAIQHAMDKGYSVRRGRCAHIFIKNLIPVSNFSVKWGEDAGTVGNFHFYYASDKTFQSNMEEDIIEFIVAKNIYQISATPPNPYFSSYIDFIPNSGQVSQDYRVTMSDGGSPDYEEIPVSEDINTLFNPHTDTEYFLQTIYDYAVRLYRANKDLGEIVRFGYQDIPSNKYNVEYVEYVSDAGFDLSNLKSIKRFITKDNGVPQVYRYEPSIPPESDISNIYLYSLNRYKNSGIIKSLNDIKYLILDYFSTYVSDISITDTTAGNRIVVYYTTSDGQPIPSNVISNFHNDILKGDSVNKEIVLQQAIAKQPDEPYYITIKYSSPVSSAEVMKVINRVKERIGGQFNPYQLISDIQKEISNITLIEYTSPDKLSLRKNMKYIDLADNEYFNISVVLNLEPDI